MQDSVHFKQVNVSDAQRCHPWVSSTAAPWGCLWAPGCTCVLCRWLSTGIGCPERPWGLFVETFRSLLDVVLDICSTGFTLLGPSQKQLLDKQGGHMEHAAQMLKGCPSSQVFYLQLLHTENTSDSWQGSLPVPPKHCWMLISTNWGEEKGYLEVA